MFIESENGKSRLLDPRTASLEIPNKGRTPNPKSKSDPLEIPEPRIQSPIADSMPTSSGQMRDKSEYESPSNGEESLLSSLPRRERVRRVLSEMEGVGGRKIHRKVTTVNPPFKPAMNTLYLVGFTPTALKVKFSTFCAFLSGSNTCIVPSVKFHFYKFLQGPIAGP